MGMLVDLWKALTRRKSNDGIESESKLARVLNLFDLVALGVGSTLGLAIYVLAGSVAYDIAGPAVTLSFLIAGIASAFAGICYAEFAARVPKSGSAYIYSYITIGEFVAFTIGWNLILEYVIGTASVASGLSRYLDSLMDNKMSHYLQSSLSIKVDFLGQYPDFLAFGMVLLLTVLLSFGVKESSFLNNIFTTLNLLTISVVIIAGSIYADPKNWSLTPEKVPGGFGKGGFMPFGFAGVMAGAAKCFYGFVGFDCIATTGEEAINPRRNIPLAIIISLIIIFLSYFGVSTVLTMMLPYYSQNPNAPFPTAFESVDASWIKWIVTVGAVFALCASLLGAMLPTPRIFYAMANDGVLFKKLAAVNNRTQTPLLATITSGLFAAIMALLFDVNQLIDMMSIGTLMAYTIVAICIVVLRYEDVFKNGRNDHAEVLPVCGSALLKQLLNWHLYEKPNSLSSTVTKIAIVLFAIICAIWCGVHKLIDINSTLGLIISSVTATILILIMVSIAIQPVANTDLSFKVPLVPLIPCLTIFTNLYLMFLLDAYTWIRYLVWIILGYTIYFIYGIRNSKQEDENLPVTIVRERRHHLGLEPDFKTYISNDRSIM
uniref:Cationic amino acid transporter C-terminal domain-containing protein n=1 Tax=Glossina brevipalpis TaxID=37001 RepID=A0A1A9VZJ1_9MUSC